MNMVEVKFYVEVSTIFMNNYFQLHSSANGGYAADLLCDLGQVTYGQNFKEKDVCVE